MGVSKVSRAIKRYWAVTCFPAFAVLSIYADWNHTRQWKKSLAQQNKLTS